MTNKDNFRPEWLSPPGDTILDILQEKTMSSDWLIDILKCSGEIVKDLLIGKHRITEEIAEILSESLGASSQFWLSKDEFYVTCLKEREAIVESIENNIPYAKMVEYNWLPKARGRENKLDNILRFFEVPNVVRWDKEYGSMRQHYAFRTSQSFNSNPVAVSAWLRQAEKEAELIECAAFNPITLIDALPGFRKLTRQKDPKVFLPKLESLCAQFGIALVIIPALPGCHASGAGRVYRESDKAVIVMSARHLSDDHFWFTFFHEIGHLILHRDQDIFIDFTDDTNDNENTKREEEANNFARDILIPYHAQVDLKNIRHNKKEIIRFASRIGVSPGIVVGQLQYEKIVPHSGLNFLKRRYKWVESQIKLR